MSLLVLAFPFHPKLQSNYSSIPFLQNISRETESFHPTSSKKDCGKKCNFDDSKYLEDFPQLEVQELSTYNPSYEPWDGQYPTNPQSFNFQDEETAVECHGSITRSDFGSILDLEKSGQESKRSIFSFSDSSFSIMAKSKDHDTFKYPSMLHTIYEETQFTPAMTDKQRYGMQESILEERSGSDCYFYFKNDLPVPKNTQFSNTQKFSQANIQEGGLNNYSSQTGFKHHLNFQANLNQGNHSYLTQSQPAHVSSNFELSQNFQQHFHLPQSRTPLNTQNLSQKLSQVLSQQYEDANYQAVEDQDLCKQNLNHQQQLGSVLNMNSHRVQPKSSQISYQHDDAMQE
eukprot:403354955